MTVSSSDIDLYVPGRGRDREYWLNYVLKLLVADIAAAGGGGPGAGLTLTAVEKDLGSIPAYAGTFQITGLSSLTVGKPVLVRQLNGPYTGKGTLADEAEMDRIECTGEVDSTTTIRVYWTATPGPVTGNFKFGYMVSA